MQSKSNSPLRRLDLAAIAVSLAAASFVGFIELHTTEVTATIATLLLTGGLLGFASPRLFWLWPILLGSAVPLSYGVAAVVGIAPREIPQPDSVTTHVAVGAFAIVVAGIASGIGAMLARSTSPHRE
jgi:hypothetical protein